MPLNRAVFNNIAEGIVEAGSSRNSTVTQNIYGDINDAADVDDLFEGLTNMVAAGLGVYEMNFPEREDNGDKLKILKDGHELCFRQPGHYLMPEVMILTAK